MDLILYVSFCGGTLESLEELKKNIKAAEILISLIKGKYPQKWFLD